MGSKLRPLYDKLYIGVETFLLARGARRDARRDLKPLPPNPQVDEQYDSLIRPYWRQFRVAVPKKYWFHLLANANRPFSPRYIPDDLWFGRIIPHYNNLIFAKALQDKCLHSVLFPDMRRPVTVVKRIAGVYYDDGLSLLTEDEAVARCHDRGRILAKPSVGSGQGHSIRFYDSAALSDGDIRDIFRQYGDNFIIQEKMAQHPDLAKLNPGSLNTIRIITFLHGGQVRVLASILRMGGSSSEVDNTSQGGYKAAIGPDGRLDALGMDHHFRFSDRSENGTLFASVTVPSFARVVESVCAHAAKMSHFKIIGWDMAVAPDGEPVLVEYNVIPAQAHAANGPIFGDLTDTVLAEVFGKRGERP